MTDRYRTLTSRLDSRLDPAKVEDLRRHLHARLATPREPTALITLPADPEQEEVLMSIDELTRNEAGRRRRSTGMAIGAAVVAVAATIGLIAVVRGGDGGEGPRDTASTAVAPNTVTPTSAPPTSAPPTSAPATVAPTSSVSPTTAVALACVASGTCQRGVLAAGTYETIVFEPAFVYTVPAGWNNISDVAGGVYFRLETPGGEVMVDVYRKARVPLGCQETPDPAVGPSVDAIAAWLTVNPALTVTEPVAVDVGGLRGVMVDVRLDPTWTGTCPDLVGDTVTAPVVIGESPSGFFHGVIAGVELRLYLLDVDGETLLIEIGPTGNDPTVTFPLLASYEADVTPFVDSLRFDV